MLYALFLATLAGAATMIADASQGRFTIMAPSTIRPGMDSSIFINVMDKSQGTIRVTAEISEKKGAWSKEIAWEVDTAMTPVNVKLPMPADVPRTGRFQLRFVSDALGLNSTSKAQVITVKRKVQSIFVQTDKAIYKPGETVKFRVLVINSQLKVNVVPMNITIQDPQQNKVKQWLKEVNPVGVVTKEYKLSDQMVLGDWVIKVDAGEESFQKSFTVQEYVLPKFEVKVTLPTFMVKEQLQRGMPMKGTVEAKYTYGKPVKGKAEVEVQVEEYSFFHEGCGHDRGYNRRYYVVMPCKVIKLSSQLKDGKADFSFTPTQLASLLPYKMETNYSLSYRHPNYRYNVTERPVSDLYLRPIKVRANVTEEATQKVLSGANKMSILNNGFLLSFLGATPATYKDDMTYTAFVSIKDAKGASLPASYFRTVRGDPKTVMVKQMMRCTPQNNDYYPRPMPGPRPGPAADILPAGPVGPSGPEGPRGDEPAGPSSTTTPSSRKSTTGYPTTTPTTATKAPKCPDGTKKETQQNYTISENGIVIISVTPPKNFETMTLTVNFVDEYNNTQRMTKSNIKRFRSKANEGLQIKLQNNEKLKAGSSAVFEAKASEPMDRLYYLILNKGAIVHSGMEEVTSGDRMTHSFSFFIDPSMAQKLAPNSRILAYYISNGNEIIPDTLDLNIDGQFANHVSIGIRPNMTKPGSEVDVHLAASPNSTMFVLAVDQSTRLLATGNDVTKDMVADEMRAYDSSPTRGGGRGPFIMEDRMMGGPPMCMGCGWWPMRVGGGDSSELIKNAGLLVFTDNVVFKTPPENPRSPPWFAMRGERGPIAEAMPMPGAPAGPPQPPAAGGAGGRVPNKAQGAGASPRRQVTTVRQEFPETWLWTDVLTGPTGKTKFTAKAPDTITKYVATAFAVNSETGLGITDTAAEVTIFMPFFVSLNLPYSLIRKEQFAITATVFNYLTSDQKVFVTLKGSTAFDIQVGKAGLVTSNRDIEQQIVVPANDAKTVSFWVIPVTLGRIQMEVHAQSPNAADGLRREIIVLPEGKKLEMTVSSLVSLPREGGQFYKTIDVKSLLPPKNLVDQSVYVRLTAIGDIMGPTINNLGGLIRMPYGCGEQNMINFVPNIYALNYIKASKQSAPQMEANALRYMETGYSRELTYKHRDGSFSAFGESDQEGSNWLTAFVIRSFKAARDHIFIDESIVNQGTEFILQSQNKNGSFHTVGRVIHDDMMGGDNGGLKLTAYIIVCLLENNMYRNADEAIDNGIQYLESQLTTLENDPYTLSIVAYCLGLKQSPKFNIAMKMLDKLATEENGMRYWKMPGAAAQTEDEPMWRRYRHQATREVEMTSYIVLCNLLQNQVEGTVPMIKWLTSQMNEKGGFSSTQDTIIALAALAKFAEKTNSGSSDVRIQFEVNGNWNSAAPITATNALIMQSFEMDPNTPVDQVVVKATGSGMAVVQLYLSYYVDEEEEEPKLELDVKSQENEVTKDVTVDVCAKWKGKGSSGMSLIDVQMLSGYAVDVNEVTDLNKGMQRAEFTEKVLTTYWNEIEKNGTCFKIIQVKENEVAFLQRAQVKLTPYYSPGDAQTLFYEPPAALQASNRCEACPLCCLDDVDVIVTIAPPTGEPPVGGAERVSITTTLILLITMVTLYLF